MGLWLAVAAAPAGGAPAGKMRVAVLDFENTGTDRGMDALGKGLQSMFMTDLGQVGALQIVERARLADVQRELKLGRSRGFDPKTASRVGKLAGASHLVTGTFTMAGKKMRMDCRLFSVEDGAVLLAEKSEGDADGFFEVQKGLVKKVLDAVSVRIEPKERAALMRVQTADLGALTAFSNGLALADDRRYEEALEAIKEARRRDQDFKLAETTQAEYERVVAELRTEAVALSVRDRAGARSKTQEATRVESAALGQLFALAARKGDGARGERVAALSALAGWLSARRPQPSAPPAIPDGFTRNCMADSAMQNYLAEALRLYPKVPLVPERPELDLVLQKDAFPDAFKKQVERAGRAPDRRHLFPSVGDTKHLVERLRLMPADAADFHHRIYKMVLSLGPPPEWRAEHLTELGFRYRQAARFDRSTELFKQAADASTGNQRARALQEAADEIELNKKLSQAMAAASTPLDREFVQAAVRSRGYELQGLSERRRDPEKIRRFPVSHTHDDSQFHGPLFLGKHPVWQFGLHEHALGSGPRRDGLRTSELRYFWDQRSPPWSENLAVLDCTPRKDHTARFSLSFTPPADFTPQKVPAPGAEAAAAGMDRHAWVGWLFGVNHPECCEATGHAIMFAPDAVRLVQVTQNPLELKARDRYAKKVVEERKLDLGGPGPHKVSVKIAGDTIDVEVGGKAVKLRAPRERDGYYGIYFGGHGFVSVADVGVSGS